MEDYLPESLCRTCLQSSDQLTSLHLKDDDTGLTLLDKLRFCSSMQVPVSEHTPSNACAPCVRCITDYYDFKRRCEQSEQTLEELCAEYIIPKVEVFLKEEEDDGDISKVAAKTEPDDTTSMCDDGSDWTNISEEVDGATIARDEEDWSEGKPQFACETCGKCFTRNYALKRHRCVHELQFISVSGESSINLDNHLERQSCNVCGLELNSEEDHSMHVQSCLAKETDEILTPGQHKEGSNYVCETCGKVYRSVKWLRIHKTESHGAEKPVYKCRVCGKTYNFISSLNAHRRTHKLRKRTLNLPNFKCDICKKSFKTKHDLRKHNHRHLLRKRQCDGCSEVFDSLPELLEHRASAHPELHPYVVEAPDNRPSCGLCKRTFSDRSSLRRHLRLHTVEQPKSPIDLTTEVLSHQESSNSDVTQHDNEDKKCSPGQLDGFNNLCDMCSRTFPTTKHLKRHKIISHSERRHRCNQCSASYRQAYLLRRHMKTHREGPKYVCDTCGKAYRFLKSLQIHNAEKHAIEKPIYTCNVCGKTYNLIGSYNTHKRTHKLSDRLFNCDICGKSFKTKQEQEEHVCNRQCDGCIEVFDSLPEMLEHRSNAHPDLNPYVDEDKNFTPDPFDNLKKDDKHLCDMCPRSYPSDRHLKRHKMVSHSERRHVCVQCGASYAEAYRLRRHMQSHEQGSKYICETCGNAYRGRRSLRIHMRESHGAEKPVYECNVCGKTYNFISSLYRHKRMHNQQKPTPKAPDVGLKMPEMLEHKASAHPDLDPNIVQEIFLTPGQVDDLKEKYEHSCDQCPRSFATIQYLRNHKAKCHSDRQHQCDQCGSSFSQAHNLRRHQKRHVPGVKFICETCGKEYSFEESLRLHIEEKHSAEKPIYTCKVCGKTYNHRGSLDSHKRTHIAVKDSFKCDRCNSAFPSRTRLVRHIKHTHDKTFSCDMCDKRFAIEGDLLKHKTYHANEMAKPYACTLCKKRFSTTSAVSFHVSTLHNGKKHLKCDICGMEFYNRFHHAAHYSSHTGIKPYRCDGCGLGYNYNRDLKRHKKKCASLLELARQ